MSGGGYLTWDTPVYARPPVLDGAELFLRDDGQGRQRPHDLALPAPGLVFETLGQEDRLQLRWLAADVPVGLRPAEISYPSAWLAEEETYNLLRRAQLLGQAVTLYPDLPLVDVWSVDRAPAGQDTWQISRPVAWGVVSGITTATRPPVVLLDGTALTDAGSSPPAAGEYFITAPDAAGYSNLETDPAGIAGTWLELRYHALHRVRVGELSIQLRQPNGLYASVTLSELRQRRWS